MADVHIVSRRRSSSVWKACPVCIRVDKYVARGGGVKPKTIVSSAAYVAKNPLEHNARLSGHACGREEHPEQVRKPWPWYQQV